MIRFVQTAVANFPVNRLDLDHLRLVNELVILVLAVAIGLDGAAGDQ